MKRLDAIDICLYVIITPVSIIASLMMIISFIGLHYQKDYFINQNEYCVVLNKDSHLRPRVTGTFVSTEHVNRINALGLTTQDTVTVDVNSRLFDNIEIGDTVKTANLR